MKTEPYSHQVFQSRERIRSASENCVTQFGQGGVGDVGQNYVGQRKCSAQRCHLGQYQLEEEARCDGALPGWVRFDWSVYPTREGLLLPGEGEQVALEIEVDSLQAKGGRSQDAVESAVGQGRCLHQKGRPLAPLGCTE